MPLDRCPALPAVAQSAALVGADETHSMLNALLGYALGFASEADDGAWNAIYVVFGDQQRRVSALVTHASDGGYELVLEEKDEAAAPRFKAGAKAWIGLGGWQLLAESYPAGSHTGLRAFLSSLDGSLSLLAREVGEVSAVA